MSLSAQSFFGYSSIFEFAFCIYYPILNFHILDMDRLMHNKLILKHLKFIKCRIVVIKPADLIIFFDIISTWSFQGKHSSIIIPRNVVFLTCLILLLLIVIVILCLCFFFEDLNKI